MKPAARTDSSAGVLAPQCNVSCLVRIVRRQDGVATKPAQKLRIERNQFFSAPPALLRPAHTAPQPPVTRLPVAGTSTCTGSETPTWDEKFELDVCPGTRLRRPPSLAPFLPISPALPCSPPRCRNAPPMSSGLTRRGLSASFSPGGPAGVGPRGAVPRNHCVGLGREPRASGRGGVCRPGTPAAAPARRAAPGPRARARPGEPPL